MTNDPRMKIFVIVCAILILGAGIFMLAGDGKQKSASGGTPKLIVSEENYDFGDISMAKGLAKHNFTVKNDGDADLKITGVTTSCMCTTVILENNGKKSPKFGMPGHSANPLFWSDTISPGQSAILEATFDPLAHGPDAVGPVSRTISITSNDGGREGSQSLINFSGNVIK